jgi:thymidylate synthase
VEVTGSSGSAVYLELLQFLLDHGQLVAPRGHSTRELLNVQIIITDPAAVHVLETSRRHSAAIAATEAAHLIAGVSSLEQLDNASGGRFTQFADRGRLRGAYGPRAYHQLENVVQLLSRDTDSRQAIVTIWNGSELAISSRDIPCTLNVHFAIRDGKLLLRTSMRSNDIFLGFPIDIEMFSALQRTIAAALGVPPGSYTHAVGSLHLYDRDLHKAESIIKEGLGSKTRQPVLLDGALPDVTAMSPLQRWHSSRHLTEDVLMWDPDSSPRFEEDDFPAWKTWQHELAGHVPFLAVQREPWRICLHCRYVTSGKCRECDLEPFKSSDSETEAGDA